MIPTFLPAGLILSRNHGLATFVHERLEWSLVDQSPEQSETEWLCVDVAGYKIINIYNLHARDSLQRPSRRSHTPVCILATSTASMSPVVTTSPDSESLDPWATSSNLGHVGSNPDVAFANFGQDSRLPDRRVLGKFPRSRHRPFLITPPRLKVPAHSDLVKCWHFRMADWKRFCLLTE